MSINLAPLCMKNLYALLLIVICTTAFFSCKKEKNNTAAIPELYTGKYLETKLRIYEVSGSNITSDTTYTASAFNENDFATFINGICTLSANYSYNPLSSSPRLSQNTTASTETYNYTRHDSIWIFSNPQPALSPGGVYTDTLKNYNNSNTWILHSVYINVEPGAALNMPETVVDAYYTQQ